MAISSALPDLRELAANVNSLTQSMHELTTLFTADKEQRQLENEAREKQFKRSRTIVVLLMLVLFAAVGGTAYTSRQYAQNNTTTKAVAQSTCTAINEANQTIHDLFAPFNTFTPMAYPEGASKKEKARIDAENAAKKKTNEAFFADLNQRTKQKIC